MKKLFIAVALAVSLSLGGCGMVRQTFGLDAEVSNPFAVATQPDTHVLAAYGLITIALEEAATLAENPETPDRVVLAIARAAPIAKSSADLARTTALEYRRARVAYERARDAGLEEQTALLATATQSAFRLTQVLTQLKTDLATLQRAIVGARGDPATVDEANAELNSAGTVLTAVVQQQP